MNICPRCKQVCTLKIVELLTTDNGECKQITYWCDECNYYCKTVIEYDRFEKKITETEQK